jgi:hypothetical protein
MHLAGECANISDKSIIISDGLFLSVNALNFCRKYMDAVYHNQD